eukprot:scaffold24005_cov120-Isochrysis_galbana.AAC.1
MDGAGGAARGGEYTCRKCCFCTSHAHTPITVRHLFSEVVLSSCSRRHLPSGRPISTCFIRESMRVVHTRLAPEPSAARAMYMFMPRPASSTPSSLDCHRTAPSNFLIVSRLSRGWVGISN